MQKLIPYRKVPRNGQPVTMSQAQILDVGILQIPEDTGVCY